MTALVLSSTVIQVQWDDVPAIHDNGVITTYEVKYRPLATFGDQISTLTTNTSLLNATLTGLEEYIEYNISVRAYTSVGPGPYSDGVNERTLEDGGFRYFSFNLIFPSLHIIVPGAPPDNVTALVLSSTEINVCWEEVPAINLNGLVTVYMVKSIPVDTFAGQIPTVTINTTLLDVTLTGLEEYVEYNISVRAYTSVGPGPYSDGVILRTLEAGNNI